MNIRSQGGRNDYQQRERRQRVNFFGHLSIHVKYQRATPRKLKSWLVLYFHHYYSLLFSERKVKYAILLFFYFVLFGIRCLRLEQQEGGSCHQLQEQKLPVQQA